MRPSSYHPDGEDMRYFEASGVSAFGQGPYRFADERGNKLDEGWRGRDSWYEKTRSGDHVVEYDSLSHCHSWMGEHVNVTRMPIHNKYLNDKTSFEKGTYDRESRSGAFDSDITAGKVTVFSSEDHSLNGTGTGRYDTEVWELEAVGHREIVADVKLLELIADDLVDLAYDAEAGTNCLVHMVYPPQDSSSCVYSFALGMCLPADSCSFKYRFGDLSPSTSCRLREETAAVESDPEPETIPPDTESDANEEGAMQDSDCSYSHTVQRCVPMRNCKWNFEIGDVTPSQSCRLRVIRRPPTPAVDSTSSVTSDAGEAQQQPAHGEL